MKRLSLILLLLCIYVSSEAQLSETFSDDIQTLQVLAGADGADHPVIRLGSQERLYISFDDLRGGYRRYTYDIQHLDYALQPTPGLFESEYVKAANERGIIADYEESSNTLQNYTHYSLTFPNEDMRPIISGNYWLNIYDEDSDDYETPIARIFFAVLEPMTPIWVNTTANTDIDSNDRHQQLSIRLSLTNLKLQNPDKELKIVVLQNRRPDNAVIAPPITQITPTEARWEHDRRLIFRAGNEYRSFEMLTTQYAGLGFDRIRQWDEAYHALLLPADMRHNYLHQPDRNGQRVVRTVENYDNDSQGEYINVYFQLKPDDTWDTNTDIYLSGQWAYNGTKPRYHLTYNPHNGYYEGSALLKTGYYSYLFESNSESPDGDFWQTENEYAVYAYLRSPFDRHWRLVGQTSPATERK